jgi:glycosyltransferase involved in cell wall biosynthesis
MKKHIIITKLFDSGGSNTALKTLINYLGEENVILILENKDELQFINEIYVTKLNVRVISSLHAYAHLQYQFTTNIKETLLILRSIIVCLWLSVVNNFADITISAVEPERHIYLFWIPFIKIKYLLHSTPLPVYTPFTTYTCNKRLGKKKIIAVSEFLKEAILQNWHIVPERKKDIVVIHNSLLQVPISQERYSKSHNRPLIILTIGRLNSEKNPQTWYQVAKNITCTSTGIFFYWLGNGPELKEYISITRNNNQINFLGASNEPFCYLQNATIYYQPSLFETHGIAVVEAMAAGLPCVVSKRGGLTESVLNNYNGFVVDAENIEEHINALMQLIHDPNLREVYGKRAKKRYLKLFDYSVFKSKMDKIYS